MFLCGLTGLLIGVVTVERVAYLAWGSRSNAEDVTRGGASREKNQHGPLGHCWISCCQWSCCHPLWFAEDLHVSQMTPWCCHSMLVHYSVCLSVSVSFCLSFSVFLSLSLSLFVSLTHSWPLASRTSLRCHQKSFRTRPMASHLGVGLDSAIPPWPMSFRM